MSYSTAWVRSVSGNAVKIGDVSVSSEPVEVVVSPALSTAYRDGFVVICDGPAVEDAAKTAPKTGGKKK